MEKIDSRTEYEGSMVDVQVASFRSGDGSTREREIVCHPGAVAIIAYDERSVFLVRQPREAVGVDDLLELPAGKLGEDESPLVCAKRELREEVGVSAGSWRELKHFYSSPGFTDEEVWVFAASDLERGESDPDEGEEIDIVEAPIADLDELIDQCADAKSLVGLLMLRDELAA